MTTPKKPMSQRGLFPTSDRNMILRTLYLLEEEINNAPGDHESIKIALYHLLESSLQLNDVSGETESLDILISNLHAYLIENVPIEFIARSGVINKEFQNENINYSSGKNNKNTRRVSYKDAYRTNFNNSYRATSKKYRKAARIDYYRSSQSSSFKGSLKDSHKSHLIFKCAPSFKEYRRVSKRNIYNENNSFTHGFAYPTPIIIKKNGKACSWKPRNIVFNQTKALSSISSIIVESYGLHTATNPAFICFVIIFIMSMQLNDLFLIQISKKEIEAVRFLTEKNAFSLESAIEMKSFPFNDDDIRTLIKIKDVEIVEDKIFLSSKIVFQP